MSQKGRIENGVAASQRRRPPTCGHIQTTKGALSSPPLAPGKRCLSSLRTRAGWAPSRRRPVSKRTYRLKKKLCLSLSLLFAGPERKTPPLSSLSLSRAEVSHAASASSCGCCSSTRIESCLRKRENTSKERENTSKEDLLFVSELKRAKGKKKKKKKLGALPRFFLRAHVSSFPFSPRASSSSPNFSSNRHGPCRHAPRARPRGLHPQRCWYVETVEETSEREREKKR